MVRELNTFELAERQRLSHDVVAGFVKSEHTIEIVRLKIQIILLGVITQTLSMVQQYDEQVEKTTKDIEQCDRLKTNFYYLSDIIIPHTLEMDFLDGIKLTVESGLEMYLSLSRKVTLMEHRAVPNYNSEHNVQKMLRWDNAANKYMIEPTLAREFKRAKH